MLESNIRVLNLVTEMAIYLILLAAICVIVLTILAQRLYKRYQFTAIVNKIPGPKAYPLLGNVFMPLEIRREDRYEWFSALCNEYKQGIFRTWTGLTADIYLTTAETISGIIPSKNLITKSERYKFSYPWVGTGLITSTGDKWHRHRKLIAPTFHFNILDEFAVIMSEKAEILKQCIAKKLKNDPNNPIDMLVLMTDCALDIICETAMGININAQMDQNAEYPLAIHSITTQVVERQMRPWLHADWIYYRTSRGQKFKRTVETLHKFTYQVGIARVKVHIPTRAHKQVALTEMNLKNAKQVNRLNIKVIRDRKLARKIEQQDPNDSTVNDNSKRRAFLDHLLDACDRDNMPLTDEELREEVDTFMFAGHDTTATAMSWVLFCIGSHPDVEEKIHQEQLQVFGDSAKPATLHQLSQLQYLERVIKETLRLFPTVPAIGRFATEDIEIAGYQIPQNSLLELQLFRVHRDPKHWPEPEKFDPDRFLPKNSQGRHPYAYIPFSGGPRNCIGQKFALIEEKTILTAILRTWRVKSLLKFDEAKCYIDIILRPQDGTKIYFTRK